MALENEAELEFEAYKGRIWQRTWLEDVTEHIRQRILSEGFTEFDLATATAETATEDLGFYLHRLGECKEAERHVEEWRVKLLARGFTEAELVVAEAEAMTQYFDTELRREIERNEVNTQSDS